MLSIMKGGVEYLVSAFRIGSKGLKDKVETGLHCRVQEFNKRI